MCCSRRAPSRHDEGQTTVEWVGLVVLVSVLLLAVLAAAGAGVPGASLARAIAAKIVCALELGETCATEPDLVAAYGVDTAALVREHAPWVFYEEGMTALPVDYRDCRESECSVGEQLGAVTETDAGLPVTAFVHVVDCRDPEAAEPGVDCRGTRAGKLYLQYWFYYTDSATLEGEGLQKEAMAEIGRPGFHPDDWESYQVRIGPHGVAGARRLAPRLQLRGRRAQLGLRRRRSRASTRRSRTSGCARTGAGAARRAPPGSRAAATPGTSRTTPRRASCRATTRAGRRPRA